MMGFRLQATVAALVVLATAATASLQPGRPEAGDNVDWREIARQDVLAAYDQFAANHPGMHDPAYPGFAAQLARARNEALIVAGQAASQSDYAEALDAFSGELGDGHALVAANPAPGEAPIRQSWPGFVAAWRGAGLIVHGPGPGAPAPAGSAIVSCDGIAAADLVRLRLGRAGFRPAEAGQWWARAPLAFVDREPPGRNRPQNCLFRTPEGELREAALSWTPAPADLAARRRRATDGEPAAIGLTEPRPGLFLIGLTDFQPDAAGVAAYRALFATLRRRRAELIRARAIVLDLRGNDGGSSDWPQESAGILWGSAVVRRALRDHFGDERIWWRASRDNVAYMAQLERQLRRDGHGETADAMRAVAEGMRASLARGEPFFVERAEQAPAAAPGAAPPTDFNVPVYVIIPGRCASACLDALDIFTRFPNSRLIGAPTSADSHYMEVRLADLPSGRGKIVIPVKMYPSRPRRSGEVYMPHILMTDADWSTASFLARIERDLAEAH